MADDDIKDEVVRAPNPSWVGTSDPMIQALAAGSHPPGLQVPTGDAATDQVVQALSGGTRNIPNYPAFASSVRQGAGHQKNLHDASTPHATPMPTNPFGVPASISAIPVSTVMQMNQHQLTPMTEYARQRVLQALMQRPHGVVPQTPLKG